jgi:hypothetical protein
MSDSKRPPALKAFVVTPIDHLGYTDIKEWSIPSEIKSQLGSVKTLYDEPYEKDGHLFRRITRTFELAPRMKKEFSRRYQASGVTNAWLKCFEMLSHYGIMNNKKIVKSFDNAAFPGTFTLAAHHLATNKKVRLDWYASSLVEEYSELGPLQDTYNMVAKHPNRWLMSASNTGDVLNVENQRDWFNTFNKSVDLYMSDLGFDVSSDYNSQETLHAMANLGQIVSGLFTLKPGGVLITKQFTFFEPFTISIIGILTNLFEEVQICKPLFSKAGNSEVYIIGLGLKNIFQPGPQKDILDTMVSRIQEFQDNPDSSKLLRPFLTWDCLGDGFVDMIIQAQNDFAQSQIDHIEKTISEYTRIKKIWAGRHLNISHITKNNAFARENSIALRNWYANYPIKPLAKKDQLI